MRKKLMEIFNCYGCHWRSTINCRDYYCRYIKGKKREITTSVFKEIPDWCPLPDAEAEDSE